MTLRGDDNLIDWPALFQRTMEAVFVLNRQRRIRYVNPAWEALTGIAVGDALGLVCTRRQTKQPPRLKAVAAVLGPPLTVLDGQFAVIRQPVPPARTGPPWWEVQFLPFHSADGLLGIVGRIVPLGGRPPPTGFRILSEALADFRDRTSVAFGWDWLSHWAEKTVVARARLSSRTNEPVLIHGPAGCGKRTLARVIHHQGSHRGRTFLTIDCSAIPATLVPLVLFGEQGLAGTERLGTLFLRHIDRLALDHQARLADWLADRGPDSPRIVAALRDDPDEAVRLARLSAELRDRLSVIPISLPPLVECLDELPRLAERLLARRQTAGLQPTLTIAADVWPYLQAWPWPGNLRELDQVLAEAAAHATPPMLNVADLPAALRRHRHLEALPGPGKDVLPLESILEQVERQLIQLALQRHGGNKGKAAEMLGLWRPTLYKRLERLGLSEPETEA